MPPRKVSQIFNDLSFEKKLISIGSMLLLLSLFLPWYQDIDLFQTGDIFIGITGPLFLIGYLLLAATVINILLISSEITGKKISYFPWKSSSFFIGSGLFAMVMLIVVNSAYFHSDFGVNIAAKQSQFGMFFAFIASSLITVGGYLTTRDRKTVLKEFEDFAKEPFIEVPKQEDRKPNKNLRSEPVEKVDPAVVETVQNPVPTAPKAPTPANVETSKKTYQPFRTDL